MTQRLLAMEKSSLAIARAIADFAGNMWTLVRSRIRKSPQNGLERGRIRNRRNVPSMAGIKAFVDSCNGTLDSVPDRYMMPNGAADVSRYAVLPIVDVASESFERDLLKNHGIHTEDVMRCALEFFNSPSEDKMRYYTEEIFTPVRYCTSMMPSKEEKLEWHDHLQMWLKEESLGAHPWPAFPASYKSVSRSLIMVLL
ncbi:protein DMR6-LIKE OXYGENASE 2-like [Selaginella moellendorffii]|uniref:protein DMR6-LIKE OXYGENASE 2-like n=1 Tax=Selaginella moellendorffii TaxID=88036 RepID=UPI000D1C95BB|nr:protein DMR6-LIKE OXYGENASE 2-like [Selaginella moellendorffii]|eukprot:XP_024538676.1 protein DMR6-LIKE OXYGENASE 2-like [Selaginella moellendorffii]